MPKNEFINIGIHTYAMVSPQTKRLLMNSGCGGTKIQLSLDDVRNVWLAVPSLDEQIEITNFLDQRLSKIDWSAATLPCVDPRNFQTVAINNVACCASDTKASCQIYQPFLDFCNSVGTARLLRVMLQMRQTHGVIAP